MAEEAEVQEIEQPVVETEKTEDKTETPVEKTDKPESDPILKSLSDDSQPDKSEAKPEVKEPAEDTETMPDDEKESESEAKPEAEQEELTPEEAQKKEEARRRYEERERVRQERQARVATQTKDYVESAEDDTDKRLREVEVNDYNRTIEHVENTLLSEHERVKANPDLQMFNPENKESFDKNVWDYAMKTYSDGYIVKDQNGNMVGINKSLYQHLNETAELFKGAVKSGQLQQVRNQRKMKATADSKPAVNPKEETKDPILEVLMSE